MRKWLYKCLDTVVIFMPLVIMALLVGATWWLIQVTPHAPDVVVRHLRQTPDLIVDDFVAERFDASGALRSRLTGDQAQRFPAANRIEIDKVDLMTTESSAQDDQAQPVLHTPGVPFYLITAIADKGYVINGKEIIELHDNAYVTRQPLGAPGNDEKIEFRGDELRMLVNEDKLVSDKPVDITQDGTRFIAQRMIYHNATNVLELLGNVRGNIVQQP